MKKIILSFTLLLLFNFCLFYSKINYVFASGCLIPDCAMHGHSCGAGCEDCSWCLSDREIGNPALSNSIQNLTGTQYINRLIPHLIMLAFIIAAIVSLILLIIGGIRWVASGGEREGLAKARGAVIAAIVGLILILSVYAVLRLIEYFFGIKLLVIDINPLIL